MGNFFSFEGRIRRTTYALRLLLNIVISWVIAGVFISGELAESAVLMIIGFLALIGSAWFGLAACVQRCHDMDKPGWYCLIPIYGSIIMLFVEGTKGYNSYGSDPKNTAAPRSTAIPPTTSTNNYSIPGNTVNMNSIPDPSSKKYKKGSLYE